MQGLVNGQGHVLTTEWCDNIECSSMVSLDYVSLHGMFRGWQSLNTMQFQLSQDHFLLGHIADILNSKHLDFDFDQKAAFVVCMN